jgi:hypothetical protein
VSGEGTIVKMEPGNIGTPATAAGLNRDIPAEDAPCAGAT